MLKMEKSLHVCRLSACTDGPTYDLHVSVHGHAAYTAESSAARMQHLWESLIMSADPEGYSNIHWIDIVLVPVALL